MEEIADPLDSVLGALANRHRREIVRHLAFQPESIGRLAALRGLSLPAVNKHIGVLERAGLVHRRKSGRTTYLSLGRDPILLLQSWLGEFHAWWGADLASNANAAPYLAGPTPKPKEAP